MTYLVCDCGRIVRASLLKRHLTTKMHEKNKNRIISIRYSGHIHNSFTERTREILSDEE
jgi:hypothetical protein